jgi:hypothetical protein
MKTKFMNQRGQGMTEIVLMLPIFIILMAGTASIAYMCWQGLKVQQAANLAARINGQERISGGPSESSIRQDNGLDGGVERAPDDSEIEQLSNDPNALSGLKAKPSGGVYGKMYTAVHEMFNTGEQAKLFVPPPINQGINTDTVQVVRVLNPPKVLGFQLSPVRLEARAYGGEDTHLYALPRWGKTSNTNNPFYSKELTNPDNQ